MERSEIRDYEIFVGIDAGKNSHYLVAIYPDDEKQLIHKTVIQDEIEIREALGQATKLGKTLITIDQVGGFGRLVVAVAQDMGIDIAHISPSKFRQFADSYGEDKSDAKDAFIIADAARSAPRLIERVGRRDEVIEEIKILTTFRDDIVKECTRMYNRLHDAIHQVCPALEKVFSKAKLHNKLEIQLIEHYGGPKGFKKAGQKRCSNWAEKIKYQGIRGPEKVEEIFEALARQTVMLPGTRILEEQIKAMARRIIELEKQKDELDTQIEELSAQLPEVKLIRSIPGIGQIYGATIVAEIGDISRFKNGHHLASYAGVAPVRKKSCDSLNSTKKRKGGNRRLKNALVQAADRARHCDEIAERYYKKKRAEGKKHNAALLALARRRIEVIYAMLKHGTYYIPLKQAA